MSYYGVLMVTAGRQDLTSSGTLSPEWRGPYTSGSHTKNHDMHRWPTGSGPEEARSGQNEIARRMCIAAIQQLVTGRE